MLIKKMKTKLGVSVEMLAAAGCIVALAGGYVPFLLLFGYVLLKEDFVWLRKTYMKILVIMLFTSVVTAAAGFIPDVLDFFGSVAYMFNGYFDVAKFDTFFSLFSQAVLILKTATLLVMAACCLKMKNLGIKKLDDIVEREMNDDMELYGTDDAL